MQFRRSPRMHKSKLFSTRGSQRAEDGQSRVDPVVIGIPMHTLRGSEGEAELHQSLVDIVVSSMLPEIEFLVAVLSFLITMDGLKAKTVCFHEVYKLMAPRPFRG